MTVWMDWGYATKRLTRGSCDHWPAICVGVYCVKLTLCSISAMYFQCDICDCNISAAEDPIAIACDHHFCRLCWEMYVQFYLLLTTTFWLIISKSSSSRLELALLGVAPNTFWHLILTFNPRWGVVMTHTCAKGQGQKSLGLNVRGETNALPDSLMRSVTLYMCMSTSLILCNVCIG